MTRYFTDKVYRSMHWINCADKQKNEVINDILSILNIKQYDKMKGYDIKLKRRSKIFQPLSDCALFISGFGGLLRDKKNLIELGETLLKYGNTCFIIRTSSDNPEDFKELKTVGGLVFVPDYTVVSVKNIQGDIINVLCIGGDVTPDRSWRIKMKNKSFKFINKFEYYEDEAPRFNEEAINDIIKDKDLRIDMVVSNIPISFAGTDPFSNNIKWLENDKTLKDDIIMSRAVMDKVFMTLKSNDKNPYIWFHVQPDVNRNCVLMGTNFTSINSMLEYNDLFSFFMEVIKKNKPVSFEKVPYIQRMIEEEDAMNSNNHGGLVRPIGRVLAVENDPFGVEELDSINNFESSDVEDVEENIAEVDQTENNALEPGGINYATFRNNLFSIPTTYTYSTAASTISGVEPTTATTIEVPDYFHHFDTYSPA